MQDQQLQKHPKLIKILSKEFNQLSNFNHILIKKTKESNQKPAFCRILSLDFR